MRLGYALPWGPRCGDSDVDARPEARWRYRHLLVCLVLFAAGATAAAAEGVGDRVRDDLVYLSSLGSRVVGYPGHAAAADFIEQRFSDLGLTDVRRDTFEVAVPMDRGASVRVIESGETLPLRCLWPNLVRTPTLPPEGLAALLFYAGEGTYAELNGHQLDGRVALMEFNSQLHWLDLAALGVRGVIFIEPERTTTYEAGRKYSAVPVDVPRFWIDRPAGSGWLGPATAAPRRRRGVGRAARAHGLGTASGLEHQCRAAGRASHR